MKDKIYREDAIDALMHIIPYRRYRKGECTLLLNKQACLSAIQTLPSADSPSATEIINAYHEGVRKGIAEAYEADGLQGWMTVIRNTFCSDCKGDRHENCEYRESCYTMRVLDGIEGRQHE